MCSIAIDRFIIASEMTELDEIVRSRETGSVLGSQ